MYKSELFLYTQCQFEQVLIFEWHEHRLINGDKAV